jgi:hypothetical protein
LFCLCLSLPQIAGRAGRKSISVLFAHLFTLAQDWCVHFPSPAMRERG